jgi:quinol monooxygenase YgiN
VVPLTVVETPPHDAASGERYRSPGKGRKGTAVIFIVVKFQTKPEWTDRWPELVGPFTEATRAEEGNLWFEWSRSLKNPGEYVLVEAFRDGDAGAVHVNSDHFKAAQRDLPTALASTPKVISETIGATDWSRLAELAVD